EALEFDAFEYAELMAYASELGVAMFATAFDLPSVEFLEQFDMPAYKVASADVNNHPLLREVARTRRPIIFSTGGAAIEEVRRAHEVLSEETDQLCVLQCTAGSGSGDQARLRLRARADREDEQEARRRPPIGGRLRPCGGGHRAQVTRQRSRSRTPRPGGRTAPQDRARAGWRSDPRGRR